MDLTNLIGENILGYSVSEKLGSGALETVYKVTKQNASDQDVRALKHISIPTEKLDHCVLNSVGADVSKADSYISQIFNNMVSEIRILCDLSAKDEQHIVRYYANDILVTDTPKQYDIFVLMEHIKPLDDYIQNVNLSVRDVIKLGLDVLYGLRSCHDHGVIHRDMKDSSIFVSDKGEYKLGGFGVSKVLKDSFGTETLTGTPNFLAPEVYHGKESYTKSADLYGLGMVLYRLLNYGRNPFLPRFPEPYFAQDGERAFEKRMRGSTPALPSLGGEEIGRVVVKAISDSSERFQTADEFIKTLESAMHRTSAEKLNESTIFCTVSLMYTQTEPGQKQYISTRCESVPQAVPEEHSTDKRISSVNSQAPERVAEVLSKDVSHIEPVVQTEQKTEEKMKADTASPKTGGRFASFFFAGKKHRSKSETNAVTAILTKKEPYRMIQDVNGALKQLKARTSSKQLNSLVYAAKCLEEKLSVESNFGDGKGEVINCENDIAGQLQFLVDTVHVVENGDFEENLKAMHTAIMNINSLLRRRIELKKR